MQGVMEPLFEIVYLLAGLVISAIILAKSNKRPQFVVFGVMGLLLVFGDAFHLVPRMLKAKAVPVLMNLIGKRTMFKIIAKEEYKAYDMYAPWIEKFPEVASVQADEKRHGDLCMKVRDLL